MDQEILERIKGNLFPTESNDQPEEEVISEDQPEMESEEAVTVAEENTGTVEEETETEDSSDQEPWTLEEIAESLETDIDTLLDQWEIERDGERVKLGELKKSNLRESDYTKKTQALAEERRKFEAETKQKMETVEYGLVATAKVLEFAQQQLFHDIKNADMENLKEYDRHEWIIKDREFRDRAEALQKIQNEAIEQYKKVKSTNGKDPAKETEKLRELVPELKDPSKAKDYSNRLANYAYNIGYTQDELESQFDHRFYLMANKAMKYDELKAGKPEAEAKAKSVPNVLRPKGRKPKVSADTKRTQDLRSRLKKSGKIEDLAAAIKQGLIKEY